MIGKFNQQVLRKSMQVIPKMINMQVTTYMRFNENVNDPRTILLTSNLNQDMKQSTTIMIQNLKRVHLSDKKEKKQAIRHK